MKYAIVFITIGWSKHKKVANNLKFQKIMVFYGLGLLLIFQNPDFYSRMS